MISGDAKNGLVDALKAMIESMDEEHLYSLMEYAGRVGKELMASDKQQAYPRRLQPQRHQQPQQPQQKLPVQKQQPQ